MYYLFATTRCPQRATGIQLPNLNLFKKLKQPNIQKGHILNLCGLISYALNTMQHCDITPSLILWLNVFPPWIGI